MASLESRVAELESRAASSQVPKRYLVILSAFGDGGVPVTSLVCNRTGRVFDIAAGETEDEFTARVEAALCTEKNPIAMVNRGCQ